MNFIIDEQANLHFSLKNTAAFLVCLEKGIPVERDKDSFFVRPLHAYELIATLSVGYAITII